MTEPRLVVFSSLFPNAAEPGAGLFIRERAFRVGKELPMVVVSPKPWFPGQGLIRLFHRHYRLEPRRREKQDGIDVYFPRFLAVPGLFRRLDGLFMAIGSYPTLRRLRRAGFNLIDAHFAYPDGHAAVRLGRWLGLPVAVTLRGTEARHSRDPVLVPKLRQVFRDADFVIAVSESLCQLAGSLGLAAERCQVVGNGVDTNRFIPEPKAEARARLGLSDDDQVLVTVGGLVERKGFHRVIAAMPGLLDRHPRLNYLVVGGPSPEGDITSNLKQQVADLGLADRVHFLGPVRPDELKWPLSAADVFVLASRNEGWANVILEAMACGLPVAAYPVSGPIDVLGDSPAGVMHEDLRQACLAALNISRHSARAHAEKFSWRAATEQFVGHLHPAAHGPGCQPC